MVADVIGTWAADWAVSRRTPPPVEEPWGHYIEVADDWAAVPESEACALGLTPCQRCEN
ncbi:hypothetical protein ACWD4K_25805 [Streptomyces gelaticus]